MNLRDEGESKSKDLEERGAMSGNLEVERIGVLDDFLAFQDSMSITSNAEVDERSWKPPSTPTVEYYDAFEGSNLASSFQQGHLPLPSQPPPQHLYRGGSHTGLEFNNQIGTSVHAERVGSHWAPRLPERVVDGTRFFGPPTMMPGLSGGQQPCPPPFTPEMERALVQKVMSLTPEQINLLPPEHKGSRCSNCNKCSNCNRC